MIGRIFSSKFLLYWFWENCLANCFNTFDNVCKQSAVFTPVKLRNKFCKYRVDNFFTLCKKIFSHKKTFTKILIKPLLENFIFCGGSFGFSRSCFHWAIHHVSHKFFLVLAFLGTWNGSPCKTVVDIVSRMLQWF